MTAMEIAWLAGIIEGEGCFRAVPPVPERGGAFHLLVGMTDEDIIRRCAAITGEGTVGSRQPPGNRKVLWMWRVQDRRGVARILCAIAPLLGERRRAKAAEVTEAMHVWGSRRGGHYALGNRIKHGTEAGYQKERYRGLTPCHECGAAHRAYMVDWHAKHPRHGSRAWVAS